MTLQPMKCNCGKQVRYALANGGLSCNKYQVCKTYDELLAEIENLKGEIVSLKDKNERLHRDVRFLRNY